jgi:hypothetical protein
MGMLKLLSKLNFKNLLHYCEKVPAKDILALKRHFDGEEGFLFLFAQDVAADHHERGQEGAAEHH